MKHVRLKEARDNIFALLDLVEQGETLVIAPEHLRDRRRTPEEQARVEAAIEAILELRKGNGRASVEEILTWRDEGRRFRTLMWWMPPLQWHGSSKTRIRTPPLWRSIC